MWDLSRVLTYLHQLFTDWDWYFWPSLCDPELVPATSIDEDEHPLTKSRIEFSQLGPEPLQMPEDVDLRKTSFTVLEDWYEV
jgi:hypothetical protein